MGGQSKASLASSVVGGLLAPVTGGASLALPALIGGVSGAKHGGLTGALGGSLGATGMAALGGAGLGAGMGALGMEGMSAASAIPGFLGGSGIGAGEGLAGPGLTPANSLNGSTALANPTSGYSFMNPNAYSAPMSLKDVAGGGMAAMNLSNMLNPPQQEQPLQPYAPAYAPMETNSNPGSLGALGVY